MEFLKNFFKSLSVGKILIIIAGILLILAATMHIFFPNADPYHPIYSLGTFLALLFGGVFAIGLLFVANGKFASIPAFAGSSIGLALFIGKVWIYVSDAIVGIDATWEAPFFVTLIPIVVALLLSIVGFVLVNPVKKAIPVTIVTVMGLLFPLLLSAGGIANDPSAQAQINRALGTSTTVMETIGDSSSIDTEYYKSKYKDIPALLQAGQKQCEEVAAEGFVLLKNDGALPMGKGSKMSLFSSSVADPVYGGTGSGSVDTSTAPNMKTAMEKDGNFSVNPTLWDYYDTGAGAAYRRTQGSVGAGVKGPRTIGDAPWIEVDSANGSTFAQYGDVALFMISRVGGEGSDSPRGSYSLNKLTDSDGTGGDSTNGEYLALSPVEKGVLEGLKAKKDAGVIKKVVVIFNFANQVEASFIDNVQYGVDAAIWIGTPGSYGFNALSDILVGKINPSGHLSATFWADHHQNPALTNFGPKVYQGSPNNGLLDSGALNQDRVYTVYQEGIYLGYHYTESRYEDYVAGRANVGEFDYKKVVSYPFGYGLSYTDFEYSNLKVDKTGHGVHTSYEVSVDVKNVGEVAGKDAVEIYLDKPYTDYNVAHEIEASASELVGFAKTKLLGKNESETVKINVPERLFASYDDKDAGTYIITGGDYYLSIGHDCHDAINNALSAKGYSTTGRMDAPGAANLAHKVSLSEDKVSYATHPVTGAPVANLFQDCDYNNYENRASGDKVQYITRNNWKDTVHLNWADHVVLKYNDKLDEDLD
ncbi:MAG: glycoside hydrolase family 3 C-terminal domain-containing protein, partial [Bacilli bacterium]|nr:glycoside hydrolase family 3 C-terminal domain-containing protein [Bacilli bacterium]